MYNFHPIATNMPMPPECPLVQDYFGRNKLEAERPAKDRQWFRWRFKVKVMSKLNVEQQLVQMGGKR